LIATVKFVVRLDVLWGNGFKTGGTKLLLEKEGGRNKKNWGMEKETVSLFLRRIVVFLEAIGAILFYESQEGGRGGASQWSSVLSENAASKLIKRKDDGSYYKKGRKGGGEVAVFECFLSSRKHKDRPLPKN